MLSPKTLKQMKVALIDKSLSVQRAASAVHNLTQTPTIGAILRKMIHLCLKEVVVLRRRRSRQRKVIMDLLRWILIRYGLPPLFFPLDDVSSLSAQARTKTSIMGTRLVNESTYYLYGRVCQYMIQYVF